MTPFRRAALEALLGEWRFRATTASEPSFDALDPRFGWYDAQERVLRDRARWRTLSTTRRAGKTSVFAGNILQDSWESPNASVVYLNETRDRAARTFWEELKAQVSRAGLPYRANESKLCLRGPRNRWIRVGGGDTKRHVNRLKGVLPAVASIYVDEAQDWRDDVLRHLLAEVVPAALADRGGRLTIGGVPGPIPDEEVSLWYAITRNAKYSHHGVDSGLTMWRNPHVRHAQQLLDDTVENLRITIDDPYVQREFFGRWVFDKSVLLFGDLDRQANTYAALPEGGQWTYTSGADFGLRDLNALQLLGWNRDVDPRLFGLRNRAWVCGPTDAAKLMAQEIRALGRGYIGGVGDPAGGGAGVMTDIQDKHGVAMGATAKSEKEWWARLVANIIRTRELVFDGGDPETRELFNDLLRVERDPRTGKLRGHTPDRVDALVYACRAAWPHWSFHPPPPKPDEHEQFIQRIIQRQRDEAADDV